jgi:hypothetical protein
LDDAEATLAVGRHERPQLRVEGVKLIEADGRLRFVPMRLRRGDRKRWAQPVVAVVAVRDDEVERVGAAAQKDADQRP